MITSLIATMIDWLTQTVAWWMLPLSLLAFGLHSSWNIVTLRTWICFAAGETAAEGDWDASEGDWISIHGTHRRRHWRRWFTVVLQQGQQCHTLIALFLVHLLHIAGRGVDRVLQGAAGRGSWRCDVSVLCTRYFGLLSYWHMYFFVHLSNHIVLLQISLDFQPSDW